MQQIVLFLFLASLALVAHCATYQSQTILHVRSSPSTKANVIGVLQRGEKVEVLSIADGFGKLKRGGYSSMQFLKLVDEKKEKKTPTPTPTPVEEATPVDEEEAPVATTRTPTPTPTPTSTPVKSKDTKGELKVYVFGSGQADSQLIILPSGYTIMIDVGEEEKANPPNKNAVYVAKRLREILKTNKPVIDMLVVTHHHIDHVGSIRHGGIWYIIEKEGVQFKQIMDRNAGIWKDKNKDGKCTEEEIDWIYTGKPSGTSANWICYLQNPANKNVFGKRRPSKMCEVWNVPDKDVVITTVITDGYGAKMSNKKLLRGDWTKLKENPPDENDYSIGLLFKYNKFTYLTMGDLNGALRPSNDRAYNDVESVAAKYLNEVDAYHVDHHGSRYSSNANLLKATKPTVSIGSMGKNNKMGHPTQPVIDRVRKYGDLYLTFKGASRNFRGSIIADGDILMHTDGKTDFKMETLKNGKKKSYKLKNAKLPKCPK